MLDNSAYTALCSTVTLQSNAKGFFQNMADDITECAGPEWLRHFGRLKSNEERIAKCLTDKKIEHLVGEMMGNVQEVYRGKSAKMSEQRRLEADRLYQDGKTDKALLMYTQSVVKAPTAVAEMTGSRCLALALWNRSAIFYERKKMLYCLDDIKLSLREKLPDNLRLDLQTAFIRLQAYWRMAECYIFLKRFDEARVTLNILLQMTEKVDTDPIPIRWNEKIQSKLNDLISSVSKNQENAGAKNHKLGEKVTTLTSGEHDQMKQISLKLALTKTPEAGSYFIAADSISTGDTLVAEDAYVSCLSVDRFGSHCHNCMRRLETAIPCPDCSAIAFCSLDCRTRSLSSYHKFECRYLDVLIGSGMSILSFAALRIVSQQSAAYFEDALKTKKDNSSHPYRRVYDMIRHEEKRSADDFFRRTLMAIFLLSVLKKAGFFGTAGRHSGDDPYDINREEMLIGAILLRNLEVLQFNAHEISETMFLKDSAKVLNIGVGLYRSASYFNHECFPAVSRYFDGTKLILKAARPVRKGEVVSECYGPIFTKFDRTERQRKLRGRYWFECECTACVQDWPLSHKLNCILKLRCLKCEAPFDKEKSGLCGKCGTLVEYDTASKDIADFRAQMEIPVQNFTPETARSICDSLDSLDKRVRHPHGIYSLVADKLTRYWSFSLAPVTD